MKVSPLILLAITVRIWILTILVWTVRWIVMPWLHTWPYIPPVQFNEGIWRAICQLLLNFTMYTFLVFLMLWAIYYVLKILAKKIPFPMKIVFRMVRKATPFKELNQSGLFDLMESIVMSVIKMNPLIFVGGLVRFWQRSSILLLSDLGKVSAYIQALDDKEAAAATVGSSPSAPGSGTPEEPEEPDPIAQEQDMENKYQICLQANTQSISPGDSSTEIARKKMNNRSATVRCQAEKLNSLSV